MKLVTKGLACLLSMAVALPSGIAFAASSESSQESDTSAVAPPIASPLANTGDTKFYFTFKKSGDTSNGGASRRKDNTTPVYLKATMKKCDRCRAYIDRLYSNKWQNVTKKGKATIKSANVEYGIEVFAKAAGYKVRLTGWADSTKGDVSGVWSPDSVGTLRTANGD